MRNSKKKPYFLFLTAIGSLLIAGGIFSLLHADKSIGYGLIITGSILNFLAVMWGLRQQGSLDMEKDRKN